MKFLFFLPVFLISTVLLASASLRASDEADLINVSLTLIHAQNEGFQDELFDNPQLRDELVKLFGYENYRCLGVARKLLNPTGVTLLRPAKMFGIELLPLSEPGAYSWKLFKEEEPIIDGKIVLKTGMPVYIRGPEYGQGLLILVLMSGK